MSEDELLKQAVEVLKYGGEVFWFNNGIKHVSSLRKPHTCFPFGCNGSCCEQTKMFESDHPTDSPSQKQDS